MTIFLYGFIAGIAVSVLAFVAANLKKADTLDKTETYIREAGDKFQGRK